ncbi:MAG: DJ-1/PfpI family protein [Lachnospiraceae bacterium]|nr:DJ-1/PfpI family protein [Lachnospiraceae bacterium]
MSRAAVFYADGFEEVEALAPVDLLRRGGVDTVTVSIMGREVVHGSHGIDIKADTVIEGLDLDSFDMLVLPGGKLGHENLEKCRILMDKVKEFDKKGKYVAAICAAPTILGRLGILKGRDATCYGGMESALEGANKLTDPVVVSDHIITSRGMGTGIEFGLKLIEVLTDKNNADKIGSSVMVPGM